MKKIISILLILSFVLLSCSDKRTAEKMFQDGAALYEKGKPMRSIKTLERLSKSFPDDVLAVKANYRMAEIYGGDLQDFEKSVIKYGYIADEYPSHEDAPKARFMAAYTLANIICDYERAKEEYNKFIRDYPEHPLVESVRFELRNLGKDLDQIEELKDIMRSSVKK